MGTVVRCCLVLAVTLGALRLSRVTQKRLPVDQPAPRPHGKVLPKPDCHAPREYLRPSAPPALVDPAFAEPEDRPAVSAAEGIRLLVSLLLDFVRSNLGLRTAALYWLDRAGNRLELSRISPVDDSTLLSSLGLRDGIVGAAISRKMPVSVTGVRASRHAAYHAVAQDCGGICAVPVFADSELEGVLVVDRAADAAFEDQEVELLLRTAELIVRGIENERVSLHLERSKVEQHKLYRAVDQLAAANTEAEVIEAGVDSARQFAAFDCAVVTLFDRHRRDHEICAASGEGLESLVGQRFHHDSSLVSMVVENRHPLPYRCEYDPVRQPVFGRAIPCPHLPSLLVLPLSVHDRTLGTLVLGSRQRGAFVGAVSSTLEVLAAHLAVSLSNARMLRRMEELATLDGLTGLLNKRALLESTQQKLRSAERFKRPLSVLLCDIDFFKKVNDTHGHDIGDQVLFGFAQILQRIKRDVDLVGRFGGEEFLIVCEETADKGALLLAERIRTELEATSFPTPKGALQVTCSVGVATFPACGRTWEQLFKSADEALYASKRGGRNRVTQGRLGVAQADPAHFAPKTESRPAVSTL